MCKDNQCCCGDDHIEKDACCDSHELDCCDESSCCDESGCGCGCDHDHPQETMVVTFDDGEEKECIILAIVEVEDKEYIALLPQGQEEYFIYGYKEDDEGVELIAIESDEEFDKVGSIFEELFDQEF